MSWPHAGKERAQEKKEGGDAMAAYIGSLIAPLYPPPRLSFPHVPTFLPSTVSSLSYRSYSVASHRLHFTVLGTWHHSTTYSSTSSTHSTTYCSTNPRRLIPSTNFDGKRGRAGAAVKFPEHFHALLRSTFACPFGMRRCAAKGLIGTRQNEVSHSLMAAEEAAAGRWYLRQLPD